MVTENDPHRYILPRRTSVVSDVEYLSAPFGINESDFTLLSELKGRANLFLFISLDYNYPARYPFDTPIEVFLQRIF